MPDPFQSGTDSPLNLDAVRDELERVPVIGRETDRELLFDLPGGGPSAPQGANSRSAAEREFLSNDFTCGY
jgi:hypothetical protein